MLSRLAFIAASASCLIEARPVKTSSIAGAADETLFQLGVASGDPTPTGITLWTRVTDDPLFREQPQTAVITCNWFVSRSPDMRQIVRSGSALARPNLAHSVHVNIDGLRSDVSYWYRFVAGTSRSQIGHFRTLPASSSETARVTLAVACCQNYENGYFNAYSALAADSSVSLVLHIGDYIYDVSQGPPRVRFHDQRERPRNLLEWRRRYALYKTDRDLQSAHAAHAWVVIPDNHDATDDDNRLPAALQNRAAAYQAWYEHMPVRSAPPRPGYRFPFRREVDFGDLLRISAPDTRQFRENQNICFAKNDVLGFGAYQRPCGPQLATGRRMLGAPQEAWLLNRFSVGEARWNVLVSTVYFGPFEITHRGEQYRYAYSWDGYPAERQRIIDRWIDARTSNPLVLSGDVHSNWLKQVHARGLADGRVVAPEFVGTSISALWPPQLDDPMRRSLSNNPQVLYYDSSRRGYLRCTVTKAAWQTDLMVVDATKRNERVFRHASYVVESGSPMINRA